ncbi:MAG: hypothetical protein WCO51_06645 [bacterium]
MKGVQYETDFLTSLALFMFGLLCSEQTKGQGNRLHTRRVGQWIDGKMVLR